MTAGAGPGANVEPALTDARRLERAGRLPEAIAAYSRVLQTRPQLPNAWYNLAVLQRRNRDYDAALCSYRQALDRGVTRPEEVHLNRAVIYADHLRRDDDAEQELLAALELNPRYVPALLNLANLHEDRGLRAPAEALYGRALEADARCHLALARLANLTAFTRRDDPLIARLRQALGDRDASAGDRADLGFALGRALDACGDHPAAFAAYRDANEQSRRSAAPGPSYDRRGVERFVDGLIAAFPAGDRAAASATPAVTGTPAGTGSRPIFICGMFRSGSTLIEQILAGHPSIAAGGELDLLPSLVRQHALSVPEAMAAMRPGQPQRLAADYLQAVARLFPGAPWVTDKRPDNFLYLGLIKRLFPDARIVHTSRNPLDTCLSIFFLHLDHGMSYALDLMDTGHYYRQYRRLMAHWRSSFGAGIIDVDYDRLVNEPAAVARRMVADLGLEWDDRCLGTTSGGRSVKTASVWQVREPLHTRSSGRARHYTRELAALASYLEEP